MRGKTTMESLKAFGLKQVISYMDRDPDANIPKVLSWMERHDKGNNVTKQVKMIREVIADKNNNWYKFSTYKYFFRTGTD